MVLSQLDWIIIVLFFVITMGLGLWASRSAGNSSKDFFLSGRNMPWWLLGVSMVATTFSADTPNFVTNVIRQNGVQGNWVWWAYLLTGMLTVFIFSRLWRRSDVVTDLEFYKLRYSGKSAGFLRGFRAIYLGVVFNVLVMATVCLAAIKIGGVMLGLSPAQVLIGSSIVIVIYSSLGGLKGILLTDFFQFFLAMAGTFAAAYYVLDLPQVNGLNALVSHPDVVGKLNMVPDFSDRNVFVTLLVIPLAVQWWSSYYPGSEPGGGGYIAQRMLAAENEKGALKATLLYTVAHYALRPWPWIIIGLASVVVFPDLESIRTAFPNISDDFLKDDIAYPAMLTFLPAGLLGLVLASLIAAFMSTISTHLNWGASYLANDFYKPYINQNASEKDLVLVGRVSTVILMVLACLVALRLRSALDAFNYIVAIGAGTGLLFILRWFWWRINAFSEIAAMIISFVAAVSLEFLWQSWGADAPEPYIKMLLIVGISTAGWVLATFLSPATDMEQLKRFYRKIRPQGPGWNHVRKHLVEEELIHKNDEATLPGQLMAVLFASLMVYCFLFGVGKLLYGQIGIGLALVGIGTGLVFYLINYLKKI